MTAVHDVLARGGTLVLDGGTGSELRRRGMALEGTDWSALAPLTHYDLLRAIHADYIDAGADVITTNTFATTRFVLEAAGHAADGLHETLGGLHGHLSSMGSSGTMSSTTSLALLNQHMREEAIFASYQGIFILGGILSIVALIPVFFLQGRSHSTKKA